MDYPPLRANRTDLTPFDPGHLTQTLCVNVVIADQSQDDIFPIAYQFRYDVAYADESFSQWDPRSIRVDSDSFINLGDIDTIRKKRRSVVLRNGDTINYNHLIFISDRRPAYLDFLSHHERLMAAYCMLIDAVKTQKKLSPQNIKSYQTDSSKSDLGFKPSVNWSEAETSLPLNIRKALLQRLESGLPENISPTYTTNGKLLIELQV